MDSDLTVTQFMPALSFQEVVERRNKIVEFAKTVMVEGVDFGTIPGTERRDKDGKKIPNPTLYKPGAEKLCTLFALTPRFTLVESEKDWTGANHNGEPFFYFHYKCSLYRGDLLIAEGDGSCNSWEKKYRYRAADRLCPKCGQPTLIKGKEEYGGGWVCFTKKGGCGAKFPDAEPAIVQQVTGAVPNPDIADQVNTFQKMAEKRSHVCATLLAVNASEFFTQDLDDMTIDGAFTVQKEPEAKPMPREEAERQVKSEEKSATAPRMMSVNQREKLLEMYRERFGGDEREVTAGLDALWTSSFKHPLSEATMEEASKVIGQMVAAKVPAKVDKSAPTTPAPAVTPITFSNETNSLILQIHATAETQFGKYKGPAVKKESAQKLAAVVGDGLDKAYSAEDKELWRHAIYARITQNYGEHPTAIEHGEQMPAELVAAMYFRWVDPADAFRASKQAVNELAQLVAAIAKERGQMEMPLKTAGAAVSQGDLPF